MIRVIDYETTGTNDQPDAEIVEYGGYNLEFETDAGRDAVVDDAEDRGEWVISFHDSGLVKPNGKIPPEARAVHHISDADVANAYQLREVIDFFLDGAEIFAAHNAKFEEHFTPRKGLKWICTYKCARIVWPDAPTHTNQGLRYWLGIDGDPDFDAGLSMPPHRALPDAYVTAFILRRLLQEKSVEELLTISRYPALIKVMNFGKHKGMKFADAPADYLEWIRDKSDMNEDTKFSAKYWLQKRSQ